MSQICSRGGIVKWNSPDSWQKTPCFDSDGIETWDQRCFFYTLIRSYTECRDLRSIMMNSFPIGEYTLGNLLKSTDREKYKIITLHRVLVPDITDPNKSYLCLNRGGGGVPPRFSHLNRGGGGVPPRFSHLTFGTIFFGHLSPMCPTFFIRFSKFIILMFGGELFHPILKTN